VWPTDGTSRRSRRGPAASGWGSFLKGPLGGNSIVCPASRTYPTRSSSPALPRELARRGLGHPPRFADLLDGDLIVHLASRGLGFLSRLADLHGGDSVVRLASQTCSARNWSFVSPRRLARQMGRKGVMGLTLGTFRGTLNIVRALT
jgi:hypothetical protein